MSEGVWMWIEYADDSSGDATRDLCHAYLISSARLLGEGKIERAAEYAAEALRLAQSIADRIGEWAALGSLGNVAYETGNWVTAHDYYTQALSVARQIGHRRGEGYLCYNLSLVYHRLGDTQQAVHLAQQAWALLDPLQDGHVPEILARLEEWNAVPNPDQ